VIISHFPVQRAAACPSDDFDWQKPPAALSPMTDSDAILSIRGLRLLVVEDEALVAMLLEDMLIDLGCTVVGIAGNIPDALSRLVNTDADGAVLDVNLGGEMVFPVADALAARGTPFVFATGYGRTGLDERYPRAPVLTKPYSRDALAEALAAIRGGRAS
jgi:CheY-like chemotaxis protein